MTQPIGAGVVGLGFIGVAHIEALRRIGITVVGVADANAEQAQHKAAALGVARAYHSYEEMLDDPAVTVVHLATPNYVHYAQAKAAILADKHVICEKPLAMTAAESGELLALARERGVVHAVNFSLRFYPHCYEARAQVKAGKLGDIWMLNGTYRQDWLLRPTDWNWRLDPALGGELRAVADIGSHWLDMITFITGQPVTAVFAELHTFLPTRQKPVKAAQTFGGDNPAAEYTEQPIKTEDYASILLRFRDGARGSLTVSQVSAGRKNQLAWEIGGSAAALAWNSERPDELWIGHRDQPNELLLRDPGLLSPAARAVTAYPGGHAEGFPDTFKQLYRAVYQAVAAGAPSDAYPSFAAGHAELVLGEAILHSARTGQWVSIPEES